jgi:hypothetical protein
MEEIILVTGCDHTRSWSNVAFLGGQVDASVSFGTKVDDALDGGIGIQYSPGHVEGALLNQGPEGKVRCLVRLLQPVTDLRRHRHQYN